MVARVVVAEEAKLGAPEMRAGCVSRRVGGCEHCRRFGYWRPIVTLLLGQVNGQPLSVFK